MDVRENRVFPYLWWLGLKMDFWVYTVVCVTTPKQPRRTTKNPFQDPDSRWTSSFSSAVEGSPKPLSASHT